VGGISGGGIHRFELAESWFWRGGGRTSVMCVGSSRPGLNGKEVIDSGVRETSCIAE